MFLTHFTPAADITDVRLKLHLPDPPCPFDESARHHLRGFSALDEAFQQATGWKLTYRETPASRRRRLNQNCLSIPVQGALAIDDLSPAWPMGKSAASRKYCDNFVTALNTVLGQLDEACLRQWELAAELASCIPVQVDAEDGNSAEKLAATIQQAVDDLQVDRGYLYTLDAATQRLQLRSHAGLPAFTSRAVDKPLDQSPIDQRALNDAQPVCHQSSADCISTDNHLITTSQAPLPHGQSSLCVPVFGDASAIGTLWLVNDRRRKFSQMQIKYSIATAKMIADVLARRALQRQIQFLKNSSVASYTNSTSQLRAPSPALPMKLENIQVMPLSPVSEHIGCQWHIDRRDRINVAKFAVNPQMDRAMGALTVAKTAVHCLADATQSAAGLLNQVNQILYQSFLGDVEITAWLLQLNPLTGEFTLSGDAEFLCWQTRATGSQLHSLPPTRLGRQPQIEAIDLTGYLPRQEHIAVFSPCRARSGGHVQESIDDLLKMTVDSFSRKEPEICLEAYTAKIGQRIPRLENSPAAGLLISRC